MTTPRLTVLILLLLLCASDRAWASEPSQLEQDSQDQPVQASPRQSNAPEGPPAPAKLRQQLKEIDRRLSILESVVVGRGHERGVMERGLGWSPEIKERGFSLRSSDGNNMLHLNGGVQSEYKMYPRGQNLTDPGTEPNTFEFRRLRPILDFRLGRDFRGQIMPDLAPRRRTELYNAFIDWERYDWARVRFGQFKPALSLEKLQGEFDLVFAERSLVQNFIPFRDFGLQITGRILDRYVRYDAGVFNGSPQSVGPGNQVAPSTDNNKHFIGRLMVTPFLLHGPRALRQLEFGGGIMYGSFDQSAGQQPMSTMGQERTIFQYRDGITGNGFHTRVVPQMSWFWDRIGVMALFVHTWEPKIDRATNSSARLQHQAWSIQSELALTDDQPAYNRVNPKHPFDGTWESFRKGNWGAWTLAVRYSEMRLDHDAFAFNFSDSTLFAKTAKGTSVALNWYASREFRFQNVWEHTDFKGAGPVYAATGTSDTLIIRATLIY